MIANLNTSLELQLAYQLLILERKLILYECFISLKKRKPFLSNCIGIQPHYQVRLRFLLYRLR